MKKYILPEVEHNRQMIVPINFCYVIEDIADCFTLSNEIVKAFHEESDVGTIKYIFLHLIYMNNNCTITKLVDNAVHWR